MFILFSITTKYKVNFLHGKDITNRKDFKKTAALCNVSICMKLYATTC